MKHYFIILITDKKLISDIIKLYNLLLNEIFHTLVGKSKTLQSSILNQELLEEIYYKKFSF